MDFYEILEVNKNATHDEIRKAYRRLSMKWHPDKNRQDPSAEEKMKQIGIAYSVLSDPEKKSNYDREKERVDISSVNLPELFKVFMGHPGHFGMPFPFQGHAQHTQQNMMPEFNVNHDDLNGGGDDIWNAKNGIFNVKDIFDTMRKPPPIVTHVTISLKEAYEGVSRPLNIHRWLMVNNAKSFEDETIYVSIPAGVDDNELIIMREKGHSINHQFKGDVKIFIKIENDTDFKRHGLDLDYTKIISLKDALCGFSFDIHHLNGICYKINNTSGTIIHPLYKKTIPKKGMKRDEMEGNLNIHFIIEFPKELSSDTIQSLRELL
jgi:DnaJ-class molecular chaperone